MNLPLPTPPMLLAFMFAGEAFLVRKRLSGAGARKADRGSLPLLVVVIGSSLVLARLVGGWLPQASFVALAGLDAAAAQVVYLVGLLLFVAGLALRWYSMNYLGRLFTFDVAIAADHQVIDTGPYRYVRHPAYTGSLLSFLGLGVCGGNALSLLVLMVPILWAFGRRMAIEEAALLAALGQPYADYSARTKRLVPFVY